jgi:hypothetical protein
MDPDAKPHLPILWRCAVRCVKVALNSQGRQDRPDGCVEHSKDRVASHVDDTTMIGFDLLAED